VVRPTRPLIGSGLNRAEWPATRLRRRSCLLLMRLGEQGQQRVPERLHLLLGLGMGGALAGPGENRARSRAISVASRSFPDVRTASLSSAIRAQVWASLRSCSRRWVWSRRRRVSALSARSLMLQTSSKGATNARSALILPLLPLIPALSPLHKAEEHRIGLHFRGPERSSKGQTSQRPHA
jgi:hypothetical protein